MGKKKETSSGLRGLLAPFRTGPPTTSNTPMPLTSLACQPGSVEDTPSPAPIARPSAPLPYVRPPSSELVHIPGGTPEQRLLAPVNIGSPLALGEFGQITPAIRGRANSLEMDNLSARATPIALAGVIEGQRLAPSPPVRREITPSFETQPITDPRLGHLVGVPIILAPPKAMPPGFSESQPVTATAGNLPFGIKRDRDLTRSPSNVSPIASSSVPAVEMTKTTSLSRFGTMLGLNTKKVKKDTRTGGTVTMVTPGKTRQEQYQALASPPPLPSGPQPLHQQRPQIQQRNMSLPSSRATRARFTGDVYTVRSPSRKVAPATRPMGNLQMNTLDMAAPKPPAVDTHLDDAPTCSDWPVLQPTTASPIASGSPSGTPREVNSESHKFEGRTLAHSSDVQHPSPSVHATTPQSVARSHPTGSDSRSRSRSSPWEYVSSVPSPVASLRRQTPNQIPSDDRTPSSPTVLPSTPISRLDRARATLRRVFTPPGPSTQPPVAQAQQPTTLSRATPPIIPVRTTSIQHTPLSDTTTPRQSLATPVNLLPPSRPPPSRLAGSAVSTWGRPASDQELATFCPSPFDPAIHGTETSESPYVSPCAALPDNSPLDPHGVLPSWVPSPGDEPQTSPDQSTEDEITDPDTSMEKEDGRDPILSHKRSMKAMQAAHDRMRMMASVDPGGSDSRSTRTISGTGTESSFGHTPEMQYMKLGKPASPRSVIDSDTESRISPRQVLRVEMIERQLSVLARPIFITPRVPIPEPEVKPALEREVASDDVEEVLDQEDFSRMEPSEILASTTYSQIDRLKSRLTSTESPQTPSGRQHQRTPSSRLREILTSDDSGSESSRVYAILSSAKRDRDTDKAIEALHETARQAIQSPLRRNRLTGASVSGTNRSRPSTPGSIRTVSRTMAGARPRKLTFSSATTTTADMPTMSVVSDESRISKRIVSPWRDGVGYALKKREEKEGPLKHGPRPSMAGSADWTRRSSKGTEGSVVNDEDQPPVPKLSEHRNRASLGVVSTSAEISPKSQTRLKADRKDLDRSLSVSTSNNQLHATASSSMISPLPRSMRKVSPGIMSRATALLDRGAGESSSSGHSILSTRRPSPAGLTTAPTSLEPSDDDESGPSSVSASASPCPGPSSGKSMTVTPKTKPKTILTAEAVSVDEDQQAQERELAELRSELERNAIILRTLVDKLREQDEEDEALRNDIDNAVEHATPRSRVSSARGTPRDGASRVKVAIDVELQVTAVQSRSPKLSTPTTVTRSVARPSSLRTRTNRRGDHVNEASEALMSTPPRNRLHRQWTSDQIPVESPRGRG